MSNNKDSGVPPVGGTQPGIISPVNDHDINYPYVTDTPDFWEDATATSVPPDPMGYASGSDAYSSKKGTSKKKLEKS